MPVLRVLESPLLLVVPAAGPPDMEGLLRRARAGGLTHAASGPGSTRHRAAEPRARGVPELELAGLLAHAMPDFKTTGRYAKYAPNHQARRARRWTRSQTKSAWLQPGRWWLDPTYVLAAW